MLILMKADASAQDIDGVCERIRSLGFKPHQIPGQTRTAIGITGNQGALEASLFQSLSGVADAVPVSRPWKLVSREVKPEDTVITLAGPTASPAKIGGGHFVVMAGPCAVESREQLLAAAHAIHEHGAKILRGGAFKPRTSPYAFQGLKNDGLDLLSEARAATGGTPVITEVVDTRDVALVAEKADILQVGARNMQNFALLEAVGEQRKPVMLKRGMSATIQEWLMAAEYILARGNYQVILCERGIRTFETMTRNTLDLGSLPTIRRLTHLPIIVDPSHGTGDYRSVPALAKAAVASGVCDGLMIEVHPEPAKALSDGPQSLTPKNFAKLMTQVRAIAEVVGLKM
jgi:3-deoxy-7-phosphoheptulonate synthase